MKLTLGLLADYADVSQNNKLMIGGAFDTIFTPNPPIKLSSTFAILKIEAAEAPGRRHDVRIALRDEAGKEVATVAHTPGLPFGRALSAGMARGQLIAPLVGTVFSAHGLYSLVVFVDNAEIGGIPVLVAPA